MAHFTVRVGNMMSLCHNSCFPCQMTSLYSMHDFKAIVSSCTLYIFFFSFTLYPAYSKVGRGSLVSRHSAPHYEGEWRNSRVRALIRYQSEEKWTYEIFHFPRPGIEPTTWFYSQTFVHTSVWLYWIVKYFFLFLYSLEIAHEYYKYTRGVSQKSF